MPVLLTYFGKKSGVKGGRSLTYVLGNMLSAGGTDPPPASQQAQKYSTLLLE